MLPKYLVKVIVDVDVEAKDIKAVRKEVNGIPWPDVLNFEYPRAGFMREVRLRGVKGKIDKVSRG